MLRRLCLFVCLIITVISFVPKVLNYQGKLINSSGVAINDTITMTFRLYTSEAGGSPIWEQTIADVPIRQGLFSVELSGFPDSVDFSEQYWLEVEAGDEIFYPREKLVSAPYSIKALSVEKAIQAIYTDSLRTLRSGRMLFRAGPGITLTDAGDSIIIRIERDIGIVPAEDFTLTVNQASISVYRGGSASNRVSIISLTPGVSSTVSLSVEGLPEGTTASFTPSSCTPTCASDLVINTTPLTPPGTYTITVIGATARTARIVSFTLTVNVPFDFEIVLDPPSQAIDQGSQTSTEITVNLLTGFPDNVTFSISGLPTGCYATFSPTSCILSCSTTLTINTSITTPPGTYPCQIAVMSSRGVTRTTTFTLTVRYFNFTLSLSSSSGTIDQGGNISTTLTATLGSEVPQSVNFSLLPSPMYEGITATLTTATCTPTCQTTLNITASQRIAPGNYPIDIVATAIGGSSDTIRYNLTVNMFNFSLSLNPLSDTVSTCGSPCNVSTVQLTLTRTSPNSQSVNFSASGIPEGVLYEFNPSSCEPGCLSTLTFTAEPDATIGLHNITITAQGVGGATRNANFALVIGGTNTWTQTSTSDFNNNTNVGVTTNNDKVSISVSSTPWYNSAWTRRRPVTITNSGGTLIDYQVLVNVAYDSDMRSDFGDLRFTAGDGTTELNYWVETYTAGSSAVVWVKVSSVPSGNSTIYMYYGNPSATSASNYNAVADSINYVWTYATGMNEFSSTSFVQIPGTAVNITTSGNPVLLIANVDGQSVTNDSWATFTIRRNGVNLSPTEWGFAISVTHSGWNIMHPMFWIDTPPAGTYTYDLAIRRGGSYNYQVEETCPSVLIAIELKNINYAYTYATGLNEFSSTSWTQIPGSQLSITTKGYPVLLLANVDGQSTGGDGSWAFFAVRRDGINLSPSQDYGHAVTVTHNGWNKMHPIVWIDTPSVGSHTYDLVIRRGGSYNYQIEEHNPTVLIAVELKGFNLRYIYTTGTETYSSTSWTDVVGTSVSTTAYGNPLLLLANMDTQSSGGDSWGMATIFRGTTQLSPTSYGLALIAHDHNSWNIMGPMFWIDPVTAGTYSYKLSVARGGSYNIQVEEHNPSFLCVAELRHFKYSSYEPTATIGEEESISGTTTTQVIAPSCLCNWGSIVYNVETPSGSSVVVDILDAAGNVIMSNVSSGANISSITQTQIRLRATLSTTNPSSIPSLLDWTITYYGLP